MNIEELKLLLRQIGLKVKIITKGECIEITSHALSNCGYSRLVIKGKKQLVHRVVYYTLHQEENQDLLVRHTCDNRACINPTHLIIGTNKDNTKDMIDRGREIYTPLPKGVNHHQAKFNSDQIKDIRSYGKRTTHKKIADLYNVSAKTIEHIRNNISYV